MTAVAALSPLAASNVACPPPSFLTVSPLRALSVCPCDIFPVPLRPPRLRSYSDDDGGVGGDGDAAMAEDTPAVALENAYYAAKGLASGDVPGARAAVADVLALAATSGDVDYQFRCEKRLTKLAARAGDMRDMLQWYGRVLLRIQAGSVTRNRAEKVRRGRGGRSGCVWVKGSADLREPAAHHSPSSPGHHRDP